MPKLSAQGGTGQGKAIQGGASWARQQGNESTWSVWGPASCTGGGHLGMNHRGKQRLLWQLGILSYMGSPTSHKAKQVFQAFNSFILQMLLGCLYVPGIVLVLGCGTVVLRKTQLSVPFWSSLSAL